MQITYNAFACKSEYADMSRIESGKDMPRIMLWDDVKGYPAIGTAVVTVTLYPKDEIVRKELDSLNEQLQATRAENQKRENVLLDRISKLQALTFVEAA